MRIGLNAGEPIAEDDPDGRGDLFGTAVIVAARVAAQAQGGEILVSDVVRQLVAGKGFLFADRGETALRGFEDSVRLYEVRWREDEAPASSLTTLATSISSPRASPAMRAARFTAVPYRSSPSAIGSPAFSPTRTRMGSAPTLLSARAELVEALS